ncbi:maltose O-acetyltransferase [Abditibacteriota bacterium]|nr:maltose O-acetyltransferase [Abditibacteriota bacterium]
MLAGLLYDASDKELTGLRYRAREITGAYNSTRPSEIDVRRALLNRLLGRMAPKIEIEPPFRCDYGTNIYTGNNFYANFGCVILDVAEVRFGENVMLAPNVQIYTAHHPLDVATRISMLEMGTPINIGNNVWIGGGAIILPGVTIGDNSVIGAGSVVTRDVPPNVIAAGNPCRVIRDVPTS